MADDKKSPPGLMLMMGMGDKDKGEGSPTDEAQDKNPFSLPMPRGFEPPSDTQGEEQFNITCRVHMDGDMIVVDSINGIKTDEGSEGEEMDSESEPESSDALEEETPDDSNAVPKTLDDAVKKQYKYKG